MVERQEIEAFLVLAEELHFRRAAERLRVAPARVTQLVQKIERRVGAPLFARTTRSVELTDVGKLLRDELTPAHAAVLTAFEHAAEFARRPAGVLRLGFLGPVTGEHLVDLADAFARRHPGAAAEVVVEAQIGDPLAPLLAGRVDVLAVHLPISAPGVTVGPVVLREPVLLGMSTTHPLAQQEHASLEDLHGIALIAAADSMPSGWQERFAPTHSPSGKPVGPYTRVDSIQAGIALGQAGKGIGLILEQFARYNPRPNVTYLPIVDAPVCEAALLWRTEHESELIRAFARLAEEYGPVDNWSPAT